VPVSNSASGRHCARIREIVGFGENLVGRLLLVDAFSMRFETLHYRWDPDNPLNGTEAFKPQA
jgi:hypothetical protein